MASSCPMPQPLSVIAMSFLPPPSTSMRMRVAPASREFSSSSLMTEAGRSTTSPAAILFATLSERTRMRPIGRFNHRKPEERIRRPRSLKSKVTKLTLVPVYLSTLHHENDTTHRCDVCSGIAIQSYDVGPHVRSQTANLILQSHCLCCE